MPVTNKKITYLDKENIIFYPEIHITNKISAENMNEIKDVVNSIIDSLLQIDKNLAEINKLINRMDVAELNIVNHNTRITSLESHMTTAETNITQLFSDTSDLPTIRNNISTNQTNISNLQNTLQDTMDNYDSYDVGTIIWTYKKSAPDVRYLPLNGQEISRTTYSDLYKVIGTTYGAGNGSSTFNLPNSEYNPDNIVASKIPKIYYYIKAKKSL